MANGEYATTQNYVGVGLRFVAILIDGFVFFILGYLIAAVTGGTTSDGFSLEGGPAFLLFILGGVYYIVLEVYLGGTLGKLALGMRVRMEDGSPITLSASIIRNLLRIVDGLFIYLVAAILVWTSPTRQRLGDRVAKTIVVKL